MCELRGKLTTNGAFVAQQPTMMMTFWLSVQQFVDNPSKNWVKWVGHTFKETTLIHCQTSYKKTS